MSNIYTLTQMENKMKQKKNLQELNKHLNQITIYIYVNVKKRKHTRARTFTHSLKHKIK